MRSGRARAHGRNDRDRFDISALGGPRVKGPQRRVCALARVERPSVTAGPFDDRRRLDLPWSCAKVAGESAEPMCAEADGLRGAPGRSERGRELDERFLPLGRNRQRFEGHGGTLGADRPSFSESETSNPWVPGSSPGGCRKESIDQLVDQPAQKAPLRFSSNTFCSS